MQKKKNVVNINWIGNITMHCLFNNYGYYNSLSYYTGEIGISNGVI